MNLPGLSNQQVPAAATAQSPRAHSGRNEAQSSGFGAMLAKVMTNPDPRQPTVPGNAGESNHETSNAKETFAKANSRAKTPERNAKAHSASDAMITAGDEGNPSAKSSASNETVVNVDTKSGREEHKKGDVNEDPETKTDTLQTGLLALESVCAPIVIVPPTQSASITLSPKNSVGLGEGQSANSRSALLLESLPASAGAVETPQGELLEQPVSSSIASPPNLSSNTNTASNNAPPSQVAGIAPNTTKSADGSAPSGPSLEAIISNSTVNSDVQATATDQKASKDNISAVNAEAAVPAKALVASPGTEADAGEPIRVVSRANATRVDLKRLQMERLGDSQPDQTVGTGTASQARQMQSEEQQNQFADRQKQNLPEKPEIIHATAPTAGSALTEDRTLDVRQNALFGIQNSDLSLRELGGDKGTAMAHDIHPSVGRLVSDISHESMILRQFKPDKLDVVIRPDADTQISLQLRLNGNDVQGIARCERGDYNLLNSHWKELQQTMDQQGVRLAPLRESGSTMSFTNGNSFGNSSQTAHDQRGRRLEEMVVSERESALRPASSSATTAVRGSRTGERLLQTWA